VVAKPLGTRTPAPLRLLIISPSEAFLPPTRSTSLMPSRSNHTTNLLFNFFPYARRPPGLLNWYAASLASAQRAAFRQWKAGATGPAAGSFARIDLMTEKR